MRSATLKTAGGRCRYVERVTANRPGASISDDFFECIGWSSTLDLVSGLLLHITPEQISITYDRCFYRISSKSSVNR